MRSWGLAVLAVASFTLFTDCQKFRCPRAKEPAAKAWSEWATALELELPGVEAMAKGATPPPGIAATNPEDPDRKLALEMPALVAAQVTATKAAVTAARTTATGFQTGTAASAREASAAALKAAEALYEAQARAIDARRAWGRMTVKSASAVLDILGRSGEKGIGEKVNEAKATYESAFAEIEPELEKDLARAGTIRSDARNAHVLAGAAADACGEL